MVGLDLKANLLTTRYSDKFSLILKATARTLMIPDRFTWTLGLLILQETELCMKLMYQGHKLI